MRLSLACKPFSNLIDIVREASRAAPGAQPADQVRYLASYLNHQDAGARTILIEAPYVDRHWLDEYSGYYATLLYPPPAKTTRLHFFRVVWSPDDFAQLLGRAIEGARAEVQAEIEAAYLGFSVIRPLPSAPLGRTILRPYDAEPSRCFAAGRVQNQVHLAGLTITFDGLPFQQQDQGVGACATTALWSALTKVMRNDGNRAPTPFAITSAATDHHVQARTLPALEGLNLDQMAMAIHAHGYQPHPFQAADAPDDFALLLKTYLRSGIPVVVRVRIADGDMHALTFVGFREEPELGCAKDIQIAIQNEVRFRSRGVVRWYVHDDRLGPYARLDFVPDPDGQVDHRKIRLLPREGGFECFEKDMVFSDALVPLYPKLRLTAEELVEFSLDLCPAIRYLAQSDSLYLEPQFYLGGDYLTEVQGHGLGIDRSITISTRLVLSRYVGVLHWYVGDRWAGDAVYDTTDLRRDSKTRPPLLALIPKDPAWIEALEMMRGVRFGPLPLFA